MSTWRFRHRRSLLRFITKSGRLEMIFRFAFWWLILVTMFDSFGKLIVRLVHHHSTNLFLLLLRLNLVLRAMLKRFLFFKFRNSLFVVHGGSEGVSDSLLPLLDQRRKQKVLIIISFPPHTILHQKIIPIMIVVTAQDMLDVQDLERNATGSNNNGQEMIQLRFSVLMRISLLTLLFPVFFSCYQPQLSRYREVPKRHKKDLFEHSFRWIIFTLSVLELFVIDGNYLHSISNWIVFELFLKYIISINSIFIILHHFPLLQVIFGSMEKSLVMSHVQIVIQPRGHVDQFDLVIKFCFLLVGSLLERRG